MAGRLLLSSFYLGLTVSHGLFFRHDMFGSTAKSIQFVCVHNLRDIRSEACVREKERGRERKRGWYSLISSENSVLWPHYCCIYGNYFCSIENIHRISFAYRKIICARTQSTVRQHPNRAPNVEEIRFALRLPHTYIIRVRAEHIARTVRWHESSMTHDSAQI